MYGIDCIVTEVLTRLCQAEEAKTRGTPVTLDSFKAWKAKFDKELAVAKAREDEEKMKGMTPKEREEYKKLGIRLTGENSLLSERKSLPGV